MTTTTSIVNIDGVEPQIFCYSRGVVGDSIGASRTFVGEERKICLQ